jgi:hypothetical protein
MKTKLKSYKLSPVRKSLFTEMAKVVCSERKKYTGENIHFSLADKSCHGSQSCP